MEITHHPVVIHTLGCDTHLTNTVKTRFRPTCQQHVNPHVNHVFLIFERFLIWIIEHSLTFRMILRNSVGKKHMLPNKFNVSLLTTLFFVRNLKLFEIATFLGSPNLYLRIAQSIIAILCNSRRKITKSTTNEPME